jgi:hypothetical protein
VVCAPAVGLVDGYSQNADVARYVSDDSPCRSSGYDTRRECVAPTHRASPRTPRRGRPQYAPPSVHHDESSVAADAPLSLRAPNPLAPRDGYVANPRDRDEDDDRSRIGDTDLICGATTGRFGPGAQSAARSWWCLARQHLCAEAVDRGPSTAQGTEHGRRVDVGGAIRALMSCPASRPRSRRPRVFSVTLGHQDTRLFCDLDRSVHTEGKTCSARYCDSLERSFAAMVLPA